MGKKSETVKVVSVATVAMWFKLENRIKKVIAASIYRFEDRPEVLSQMMLLFFNRDGGKDGDRERSEGECINFTCSFGMVQEASRTLWFTPARQLQGKKGEHTQARRLAKDTAKLEATSSLDLKMRLQEIEDRFNPRISTDSFEDWSVAGGNAIALGYCVQDPVPPSQWNDNADEFFASDIISADSKALVKDLIEGHLFSEICCKYDVDPFTTNVPRDFRRKVEAAYRPVDRHINTEYATLGLVREPRYSNGAVRTRLSAAEATGLTPSNAIFADFATS
jgi:hypothetical protein